MILLMFLSLLLLHLQKKKKYVARLHDLFFCLQLITQTLVVFCGSNIQIYIQ